MRVFLIVLACGYLCVAVHLLGHILFSRPWKVQIELIGLFFGPVVFRRTWKGIRFEVKGIPFPGSVVKYAGEEDDPDPAPGTLGAVHPLARALIFLSGPLALLGLSAALLGPIRADTSFRRGFGQLLGAVVSHARFDELVGALVRLVETAPWWIVLGVMAAKVAAYNALPVPILNGGMAWMTLLHWKRPGNLRLVAVLQYIGLLFIIVVAISYLIAFVSWLRRG